MTDHNEVIVYQDDLGLLPAGHLSYPQSLALISEALAELNKETMDDMEAYSVNIKIELNLVMSYFRSLHDTHEAALRIYEEYRTEGRQYCVYLRSFNWAGMLTTGRARGVFISNDREFRTFVRASLPPDAAAISFVNSLDLYSGSELAEATDYMAKASIPSLRILNHNWKGIVREVIRGAHMVVLNACGETAGIQAEADLVAECGMESRTIVTGSALPKSGVLSTGRFASVIERGAGWLPLGDVETSALANAIRALATDGFTQVNEIADLSGYSCWVVDRNVDLAQKQFTARELADIPYDHYLPSSLTNNWNIVAELAPAMVSEWESIEHEFNDRGDITSPRLHQVLDMAVHVFVVATTVERYHEMALALSFIGMAHRSVTHNVDLMVDCYAHAEKCAQWSGDSRLRAFFADANARLKQETSTAD